MSATKLYTPEVLGLATALAAFPFDPAACLQGEARSKSCGSTIALSLSVDEGGRIRQVGVRSQACAIGQAAASIFAGAAPGREAGEIREARAAIAQWLAAGADTQPALPDWPGLEAIARARDYPARHGAIMLAWNAASELLPSD